MKKTILIIVLLGLIFLGVIGALSSCNYQMADFNYEFDYAYISFGDGTVKKVEIRSWRDYEDGEQIQVTDTDGNVYLVSSFNCVLVKEK